MNGGLASILLQPPGGHAHPCVQMQISPLQ